MRPIVDLATGSAQTRFEVVPGGHLGMLTGRAARGTTWEVMDAWFEEHESGAPATGTIGSNPSRRYGSRSSRGLAAKK